MEWLRLSERHGHSFHARCQWKGAEDLRRRFGVEERNELIPSRVRVFHPELDELARVGAVEEQVAREVGLREHVALREAAQPASGQRLSVAVDGRAALLQQVGGNLREISRRAN